MKANIVRIHRWLPNYREGQGRWNAQKIELGEEMDAELLADNENPAGAKGFQLCAAAIHDSCRTQHAIDASEGWQVVQMRKGEVERILWDPNFGTLDIYLRAEARERRAATAALEREIREVKEHHAPND